MKKNTLILLSAFILGLPVLAGDTDFSFEKNHVYNTVQETLSMQEAMGEKCKSLSSQGLASYFAGLLPVTSQSGAKLNTKDGSIWTFSSDSYCTNKNACKITIDVNGSAGPNTIGKDKLVIPIYKKSNGYLGI